MLARWGIVCEESELAGTNPTSRAARAVAAYFLMWLAKRMAELDGFGMKFLPTPQRYAGLTH